MGSRRTGQEDHIRPIDEKKEELPMKLLDDPKIPTDEILKDPQASQCYRRDGVEARETILHEASPLPPERRPYKL
jgi:hypothetical protein